MIRTLILYYLLAAGAPCFGQQTFLMLQKKNRHKNAHYAAGDKISFRVGDRKVKTTGEIVSFRDSVVVFKDFEVSIADISSVYIDDKTKWWLRYKIEQICLIAGSGYLLLDVINTGRFNKETLVISGTLIGAGILAKVLIGNRIKIKGRTKLRIVRL